LVLEYGRVVVFLAAHPRAAVRARLPCRARGVSSGGAQPLAAVLAVGEAPLPGPRARPSVAPRAPHPTSPLRALRAARRWRHLIQSTEGLERDGKRRHPGFGGFLLQRRDLVGTIGNAAPAPVVFVAPLRLARHENFVEALCGRTGVHALDQR